MRVRRVGEEEGGRRDPVTRGGEGERGDLGACPPESLEVSRRWERSGSHGANASFTEESTTQQENVDI